MPDPALGWFCGGFCQSRETDFPFFLVQAVSPEGGGTPILQFVEDRIQTTMVTQSFEQLGGRWCVWEQCVAAPKTMSLAQSQSVQAFLRCRVKQELIPAISFHVH